MKDRFIAFVLYFLCATSSLIGGVSCGDSSVARKVVAYGDAVAKQEVGFMVSDSLSAVIQERFIRWIRCYTSYSIQNVGPFGGYAGPSAPAEYWMSFVEKPGNKIRVELYPADDAEGAEYRREFVYFLEHGISPPRGHPLFRECMEGE